MAESPDPTLVLLPPSECTRAGAMLGRAFQNDPIWAAAFPDPTARPQVLAAMFTALAKTTVASQGLAETTPAVEAVALWLRPGTDLGLWAMIRSGLAIPRFALGLPGPERKKMTAVLTQLGGRKKALMTEPHWYLSAIGVDPDQQGTGLGSALVRSGIHRSGLDNAPIYLETETEGNVAFYQNLGFEVIEEITAAAIEVPVWLMLRRPT